MTWQEKPIYNPNKGPAPLYVWHIDRVEQGEADIRGPQDRWTPEVAAEMAKDIVGVWGPGGSTESIFAHPQARVKKFRMWDDDKAMAVYGRIAWMPGYESENEQLEPLDDYGMGGVGCTIIEYEENGVWTPIN